MTSTIIQALRPGTTLLWKIPPFCGAVMLRGEAHTGLVEFYHLAKDEFCQASLDAVRSHRTLIFIEHSLRTHNPKQWAVQAAIWGRAYHRCGLPNPDYLNAHGREAV